MTESIREIVWEFIYIIEFARKDKIFKAMVRSVYKELHADHETGAADNK